MNEYYNKNIILNVKIYYRLLRDILFRIYELK